MEYPPTLIKTTRPHSARPYDFAWSRVAYYDAAFEAAAKRFGLPSWLLPAMAVVESDATHYTAHGDIVQGGNDGTGHYAYGIMQIKPDFWKNAVPDADWRKPEGNIAIAGYLMSKDHLPWQRAIAEVYHPGTDPSSGTDPAGYVATLEGLRDELTGGRTMIRFNGTNVDVALDVPFRVALIPASHTTQRPGVHMAPSRFVVHETDNFNTAAGAEMHRRYFADEYAEGRQASCHLVVDEKECIQLVPFNEVAWHGGDNTGPCNYGGVSLEICVNDNNRYKDTTRLNAEKVTAAALKAIGSHALQQHSKCCSDIGNPAGCHSLCPRTIRDEGYWDTYLAHVNALVGGTTPVVYPAPQPAPGLVSDGDDHQIGVSMFYACVRDYRAAADGVKVYQFADPASHELRAPLKKGEEIHGQFIVKGADDRFWVYTTTGARVPIDGLTPRLSVSG